MLSFNTLQSTNNTFQESCNDFNFMSLENDSFFNDIDFEFASQTEPVETSPLLKTSKKIAKSPASESSNNSKSPKARAARNMWKPHEDELLLELFAKYGPKWTFIGQTIGGRTCKQVRDRYLNHIRPDIDNAPFTAQEDQQLVSLQALLGNKWKEISEKMPGRSPAQVKNRFYLYLGPQKKTNMTSLRITKNERNSSVEMNIGSSSEFYFFEDKDIGFDFISFNQASESQQINQGDAVPQYDIFQDFGFSNFLEKNFRLI